MEKITLVLGASPNPERYSYRAVRKLQDRNIPVIAIGKKEVEIDNFSIRKGMPDIGRVHTVTLYLNAKNQKEYYDYILSLNPKTNYFQSGNNE